jgi:hypothetical protein
LPHTSTRPLTFLYKGTMFQPQQFRNCLRPTYSTEQRLGCKCTTHTPTTAPRLYQIIPSILLPHTSSRPLMVCIKAHNMHASGTCYNCTRCTMTHTRIGYSRTSIHILNSTSTIPQKRMLVQAQIYDANDPPSWSRCHPFRI